MVLSHLLTLYWLPWEKSEKSENLSLKGYSDMNKNYVIEECIKNKVWVFLQFSLVQSQSELLPELRKSSLYSFSQRWIYLEVILFVTGKDTWIPFAYPPPKQKFPISLERLGILSTNFDHVKKIFLELIWHLQLWNLIILCMCNSYFFIITVHILFKFHLRKISNCHLNFPTSYEVEKYNGDTHLQADWRHYQLDRVTF